MSKIPAEKWNELESLRAQIRQLEDEIGPDAHGEWPPKGFYWSYYATSGFMLGGIAAVVSLLVNVVAAPAVGKSPLELIRVYLTFPLGEKALSLTEQAEKVFVIPDAVILTIGCCLYLVTGMFLGVIVYPLLMYLAHQQGLPFRLIVASVLSLAVWLINFYLILNWLQPAVLEGNWITDNSILPWWVAGVTHLVFGWTLAVLAPLGAFRPFQNEAGNP